MYKALFTPDAVNFQQKDSSISPIEYMLANNLITRGEVTNLSKLLKEMVKYEIGVQQGNIEQLAAEAGPMLDFFLRVSGATIGARASEAMGVDKPSLPQVQVLEPFVTSRITCLWPCKWTL